MEERGRERESGQKEPSLKHRTAVGDQVVDWLARDKAPPTSQTPFPDPSGTTSHTFTRGECNLASEQIRPVLGHAGGS